jgi:DNA segregation ATPase FtsK/SpoIIIE, S-DNA-T family
VSASSVLSRRVSEIEGFLLFGLSVVWFGALLTYNPADPAWFFKSGATAPATNLMGPAGAFVAELSFAIVGYAAYLFPVLTAVLGWYRFWCSRIDAAGTKLVGVLLLLASTSSFLSLALAPAPVARPSFEPGGLMGDQLSGALIVSFNRTGALLIILMMFGLSLVLTTRFSFGRLLSAIANWVRERVSSRVAAFWTWREESRRERQRREIIEKQARRNAAQKEPARAARPVVAPDPAADTEINGGRRGPAPGLRAADPRISQPDRPQAAAASGWLTARKDPPIKVMAPAATATPPGDAGSKSPAERKRGGYVLPPATLLDAPRTEHKIDDRELMESARLLEEKCREFSVAGSVVQIHPGPVVTTFEFKPEAGVKYSKITSLADDLSLALRAESVLIERVLGKSTVGIQIPNQNREPISLRELLESSAYQSAPSKLTVALGKTIEGAPFLGDIATMPHLLIAGATGTGKSVALNAMITSILFRAAPEDVRLILIDPKRLELGMYEEIPHLLTPVVVDPKQAANALTWAVHEMEERYKTLAAEGVRNIEQYNRNVREAARERPAGSDEPLPKPLPYIIIVIDELADLMMVARSDVEESVARLAQMARAIGIHLLLATQRPSVDVITGLIKANLPARISFRVSSKVDSRTILDGNGAEQLLGRGDMLFLPPASARLIRVHGPYISEQETARLATFLRKQGKPVYDESITAEEKAADAIEFEKDDLYDEAARLVVSTGQASISYVQRRLRVGFSRAARLIDMMEAEGIVSPAMGGKPREVLVDKGYFDEVDRQLR